MKPGTSPTRWYSAAPKPCRKHSDGRPTRIAPPFRCSLGSSLLFEQYTFSFLGRCGTGPDCEGSLREMCRKSCAGSPGVRVAPDLGSFGFRFMCRGAGWILCESELLVASPSLLGSRCLARGTGCEEFLPEMFRNACAGSPGARSFDPEVRGFPDLGSLRLMRGAG